MLMVVFFIEMESSVSATHTAIFVFDLSGFVCLFVFISCARRWLSVLKERMWSSLPSLVISAHILIQVQHSAHTFFFTHILFEHHDEIFASICLTHVFENEIKLVQASPCRHVIPSRTSHIIGGWRKTLAPSGDRVPCSSPCRAKLCARFLLVYGCVQDLAVAALTAAPAAAPPRRQWCPAGVPLDTHEKKHHRKKDK